MKISPFKKILLGACLLGGLFVSCARENLSERIYNRGNNLLPVPVLQQDGSGRFVLSEDTRFYADDPDAQRVADFYAEKLRLSTGYKMEKADAPGANVIVLKLLKSQRESAAVTADAKTAVTAEAKSAVNAEAKSAVTADSKSAVTADSKSAVNAEAYTLDVASEGVTVTAATPQGLFYGLATFMQLLPAEVESATWVRGVWSAPATHIEDAPRFAYRGFMLDVARHFTTVEGLKKHIDLLSMFKINRLHLHLTDFQGWRIEIKKYPKLTEVGATRVDEYGRTYSGFYTQDEMRDIVAYAAERFVTIIPEIDVPGHSLAAIAAYPNLSCTGEQYRVMSRWGAFPVVFCPGKEDMFEFLDDVFGELAPIFPSEYFHIGGDECPKEVWKTCPQCQQRIRSERLHADKNHSAENRLQSYAIRRCEQILKKYGKKLIGWDEILQGGLAPEATVMSWRGVQGGIEAALMNHQVIMTPNSAMYFDFYQGDYLAEPFAWGAYIPIRKTYAFEPVADTLKAMGKEDFILGVQANLWSECLYSQAQVEYQAYPRMLAVAEVGWSRPEKKDFADFSRRLDHAAVRLDGHEVNYHIPMPEQPGGSFNHLAFLDTLSVAFTSTRPVKMVYTLDGSEPTVSSAVYSEPLFFDEGGLIKIRSVLPSGKMSKVRTIEVERQEYSTPVCAPEKELTQGLNLKIADVKCTYAKELAEVKDWKDSVLTDMRKIAHLRPNFYNDVVYHVAVADGYIRLEKDGVYQFKSDNTRVWINGKLVVDNDNKPQIHSTTGRMLALRAGLYPIKVEQISNFIGGWNHQHRNSGNVSFKLTTDHTWTPINGEQMVHEKKM